MAGSLLDRARRLRLPNTEIAERAGLDQHSVRRCLNQLRDTRTSTVNRIEAAIAGEERALRDYLLGLHPVRESDAREISVSAAIQAAA